MKSYIITTLILILHLFAFSVLAQQKYKIHNLTFAGNSVLTSENLQKQINTKPKKKFEKLIFWKKNPDFILPDFENDIDRLKNHYRRNGFLNPRIWYKIDTLTNKNQLDIAILIEENTVVKVATVNFNFSDHDLDTNLLTTLKKNVLVQPDRRFTDEHIFKTEDNLIETLANLGYPFATVTHHIELKNAPQAATVQFSIDTGQKSFFGKSLLLGNSIVPEKFLQKYILFSEDSLFIQQKVDKTQQEIFETGLFQYVIIKALKDSIVSAKIPIEIQVKELPSWSLEAGVGYGTDDRLRLSALVTRLNFLGGTRKLILKAKTSYFMPFSFESKFIQPDLVIPNLDFILNPFYVRERETSYQIDRLGGGLSLLYRLNKNFNTNLSYVFEWDDITEIDSLQLDADELTHNKSIFGVGMQYNSANNRFYPTQGVKISGNLSSAGMGLKTDYHYYKLDLSFVNYISLAKNYVLAGKLKTGVIQSTQTGQKTPIEERFYSGGASSMRGWARHAISPLNADGFPVGGNTMLEGSAELRFPLYDIVNGAVFVDFGNVWSDSYWYSLKKLRYNAGFGVSVKSPVGPIRLDLASPLNTFGLQFFIAIGHSF